MKVSIITAVQNCSGCIADCIHSIMAQDYDNIEYIVIDGGSVDGTNDIIKRYLHHISYFHSAPDKGIYDALNKGLAVATGEIVGWLNADDKLAGPNVISEIVSCFLLRDCEAVYGNLNFSKPNDLHWITRRWRSQAYAAERFKYGWMPAHPTLYLKRRVLIAYGAYSLGYGTCADYELMLRLLYKNKLSAFFLDKLIVVMRTGGASNGSLKKIYWSVVNDYRILRKHDFFFPLLTLILKKLRKIPQFF